MFFLPVCVYYFVFGWTEANHLSTVFVFGFNSADKATFFDLFEPKDGKVSINKQPVKTKYTFGVVISIDVNKKTFGVLSRGGYRSYAFSKPKTLYYYYPMCGKEAVLPAGITNITPVVSDDFSYWLTKVHRGSFVRLEYLFDDSSKNVIPVFIAKTSNGLPYTSKQSQLCSK